MGGENSPQVFHRKREVDLVSYTDGFKARMVQRMAGPEGITATVLSKEVGISQPTLSRWLREAHTVVPMGGHNER